MNREEFKKAAATFLNSTEQRTDAFVDRLFSAFDGDQSGEIDFGEFMMAVTLAVSDNMEDKLRFCFKCMDADGSGTLSKDEVLYAVKLLFANRPALFRKVSQNLNTPEKVVDEIFKLVDADGSGTLDVEELISCLREKSAEFDRLGLKHIFLS